MLLGELRSCRLVNSISSVNSVGIHFICLCYAYLLQQSLVQQSDMSQQSLHYYDLVKGVKLVEA